MKKVLSGLQTLAFMNIILALSTALASTVTLLLLGLPLKYEPLLILFLVTFAGYTLNRYSDEEDCLNHPKRSEYIKRQGRILFLVAIVAYVLALFIAWRTDITTLILTFIPLVGITLYSINWIPSNIRGRTGSKRIKEFHLVKNIFVAFVWSLAVVTIPLTYYNITLTVSLLFIWFFFFGRFLVNTIVFDLKDIEGDKKYGINSMPVKIGYFKTLDLVRTLNIILFLAILILTVMDYLPWLMHLPNLLSTLYAALYINYAKNHKESIHILCDVFVDGEYIMMAVPLIVYLLIVG